MHHIGSTFDKEFAATPLFQAIKQCDIQSSLSCIKSGVDVNMKCCVSGMTYLHVIMCCAISVNENKYVPFVYQLSNADAALDTRDKKGNKPIQLSIKYSLVDLMEALIKCGADYTPEEEEKVFEKLQGPCSYEIINRYRMFSPGYWTAVEMDKAFRVNVLVKSWCRINISRNNVTLIEFSKSKDACEKITKQLLENEATIEFAHATIAGDADKMNFLLTHYNIDLNTVDLSHRESFFEPFSPLSLYGTAIKYGHKRVLHLLKKENNLRSVQSKEKKVQSSICSIS